MNPLSKDYQVVAIAPYRRNFSPMIVPSSMTCEAHVDSTCTADAVIDGQYEVAVKRKCTLVIKVSKREFLFVR
jgi:NAD kinase